MADRKAAEARGRQGERLAALALQLKGYHVLARRVRLPTGEIDLIVHKRGLVAFVEVKARTNRTAALEAVTPTAWQRIERAAELWMARRPDLAGCDWRFDIVAVCPRQWPFHAPDAFRPGWRD